MHTDLDDKPLQQRGLTASLHTHLHHHKRCGVSWVWFFGFDAFLSCGLVSILCLAVYLGLFHEPPRFHVFVLLVFLVAAWSIALRYVGWRAGSVSHPTSSGAGVHELTTIFAIMLITDSVFWLLLLGFLLKLNYETPLDSNIRLVLLVVLLLLVRVVLASTFRWQGSRRLSVLYQRVEIRDVVV